MPLMSPAQRALVLDADNQALRLMGFDPAALPSERSRYAYGTYVHNLRAGEFDPIAPFVRADAWSIDVGANVGQYAIKLATLSAGVVVIEPVAAQAWLAEALPPNCRFVGCAAGEREGDAILHVPIIGGKPEHGGSSLLNLMGVAAAIERMEPQPVRVRTIDDIVAEHVPAGAAVGFIKIDVEGWEMRVVEGAFRTLAAHRPNLLMEIWENAVPQTAAAMRDAGYRGLFYFDGRVYDISRFDPRVHCAPENGWRPDKKNFDPGLLVNNFFFLPVNGS